MPSGAKKRKAAKKKKEKETTTNSNPSTNNNNNPHGNGDSKGQAERDSNGGKVASPTLQDQQSQQLSFNKGGEETSKKDASDVPSVVAENKSLSEVAKDAESNKKSGPENDDDVVIERQSKPKVEDLKNADVIIKHVEHDKRSSSSSSSSGSSSSDDECRALEKKSKEEPSSSVSESALYNEEDKPVNSASEKLMQDSKNASNGVGEAVGVSAVEAASDGQLAKPVLSVPEEANCITEAASVKYSMVSNVAHSELKENEDSSLPTSNGVSRVQLEEKEQKSLPSSVASTAETYNVAATTGKYETTDYSEKQPLVASAPPLVQRTSWLSCCGLFEAFSGSS